MTSPYAQFATAARFTHQSQPIPGREAEMTPNNAGGVGFILDDWERLNRFLIIGTEGGTYYVGEAKLTADNAAVVLRCLKADGVRVVKTAFDINIANRAPKVDQQLFALALALKHGDEATKAHAEAALPVMLRTGTHLLHFCAMLDSLGGWNRTKRRVVARWFEEQDVDRLAYQVLKYQQRDGWSMRDALRVSHPQTDDEKRKGVLAWICGRAGAWPPLLADYEMIKGADMPPHDKAMASIACKLPREAIPTEALALPAVWRALLPYTPIGALIRSLGKITANGSATNGSVEAQIVVKALTDREALKKGRVHPFALLLATLVYKRGAGVRGGKTWVPVPAILSALEDAYDMAFDYVAPTNKRILIGVDVSGSMGAACVGTPIPTSTAAVAMAVTLARLEPHATVVQFDTSVRGVLPITRRTGIASLENTSGGGTDLSAPLQWALQHGAVYDAVVLLTDSETWAGRAHPAQILAQYRKTINQKTKLVVCAMAANHANVVDPTDPISFGCAGLDANLPALVSDFVGR